MAEELEILAQDQSPSEIAAIRREKLSKLRQSGSDPFEITRFDRKHYSVQILDNFDSLENQQTAICGRIMSRRDMGKAFFCHVQDGKGKIQIYVRVNDLGEEAYAEFKKLDIGDIIGAYGFIFRTRRGEISVHCSKVVLLAKSLLPLPEKFHGLTDTELRYRQRYVDLIMNEQVRRTFEIRSSLVREIRKYMDSCDFMEVETPVLNSISGGATARPFITHHNTLGIDMYMRIATELHLKRLIVGGIERVYEIGRIFRNEGMDPRHNPEFTTIEAYEAYTNLEGMMDLCEGMLSTCAMNINGTYLLTYQGEQIDLSPPFRRVTMAEIVKQKTGLNFEGFEDSQTAARAVKSLGLKVEGDPSLGELLYLCFDELVESTLTQPTFVTMYPLEVSPLAKRCPGDPSMTERFELFICGMEFANAFSELNDPIDQLERFRRQADLRAKGDEEAGMMDLDFINALEYGMPPTGGIGLGIDRAAMLFTDSASIRDVILFPTMRPI